MEGRGQISGAGDARAVRFERRLSHPPEEVWAALTEPRRIAEWLTKATCEPRQDGEVVLDFGPGNVVTGRITIWEPPRSLSYGWRFPDGHGSRVSWTLEADGEGTRLTLVHELLRAGEASGDAAGWHTYLERLAGHLDGEIPDFQQRFEELRAGYDEGAATP
jgi:uncharacterized protein YndB with AHSA1/START domain